MESRRGVVSRRLDRSTSGPVQSGVSVRGVSALTLIEPVFSPPSLLHLDLALLSPLLSFFPSSRESRPSAWLPLRKAVGRPWRSSVCVCVCPLRPLNALLSVRT